MNKEEVLEYIVEYGVCPRGVTLKGCKYCYYRDGEFFIDCNLRLPGRWKNERLRWVKRELLNMKLEFILK